MFNELFDKILEKNPELKEEKSIKRDILSGSIYLDMSKIDDITIPDGYIYDEVTNQITVKDSGDLVALVKDINKKSIFSRFFTKKEKTKKEEKEENKGLISKIKGLFSKKNKKEEKEENRKGLFSRIFRKNKTNSEDLLDDPTDPDHKVKKSDIFGKTNENEIYAKLDELSNEIKEKIDNLYEVYKEISLEDLSKKIDEIGLLIVKYNNLIEEFNKLSSRSLPHYNNKKHDEIINFYKEKTDLKTKDLNNLKSEIDKKINDLKENYESLSVDDLCRNIGQIESKISEYNKKSKNKYENEDYEKIVKYAFNLIKEEVPPKVTPDKTSTKKDTKSVNINKLSDKFKKMKNEAFSKLSEQEKMFIDDMNAECLKIGDNELDQMINERAVDMVNIYAYLLELEKIKLLNAYENVYTNLNEYEKMFINDSIENNLESKDDEFDQMLNERCANKELVKDFCKFLEDSKKYQKAIMNHYKTDYSKYSQDELLEIASSKGLEFLTEEEKKDLINILNELNEMEIQNRREKIAGKKLSLK